MGKWFPEKFLTWREPQVVSAWRVDQLLRECPTRLRVLWALLIVIHVTSPWWGPQPELPRKFEIGMALAMGFFMLCLPRLTRFSPVFVRITEYGIGCLPFKDISQCSLEPLEIGAKQVWILKLESTEGRASVFGVADEVSLRHLEEILRRQGLEVSSMSPERRGY
jgi:hypothetical protein